MQSSRKQTDDKRKTTSLAEDFQLYFDVDLATTREMQLQTYRTRYRVYCLRCRPASRWRWCPMPVRL